MRVALAAPRSIGTAVRRNRARRRIREAIRSALGPRAAAPGTDLLVVARAAAVSAPSAQLREAVSRGLAAALDGERS